MLETFTRFSGAIPASRRATSKDCSLWRCLPTPRVKNIRVGTMGSMRASSVAAVHPLPQTQPAHGPRQATRYGATGGEL